MRPAARTRASVSLPLQLISIVALALAIADAVPTINVVNLIENGSFESINDFTTCTSNNAAALGCPATILNQAAPWTSDRPVDVFYPPGTNCSDGARCLDLNTGAASTGATIRYLVAATPGLTYTLVVDLGSRYASPSLPSLLRVPPSPLGGAGYACVGIARAHLPHPYRGCFERIHSRIIE